MSNISLWEEIEYSHDMEGRFGGRCPNCDYREGIPCDEHMYVKAQAN